MTTQIEILRDLIAGQSSITAISERLHQPVRVLRGFLEDAESAGHVTSFMLRDVCQIWRLTPSGMELATTPNSKLRQSA